MEWTVVVDWLVVHARSAGLKSFRMTLVPGNGDL